ncbi:MAG: hypothetical protein R3C26_05810 [Calditrichia bacterium]
MDLFQIRLKMVVNVFSATLTDFSVPHIFGRITEPADNGCRGTAMFPSVLKKYCQNVY